MERSYFAIITMEKDTKIQKYNTKIYIAIIIANTIVSLFKIKTVAFSEIVLTVMSVF